MARNTFLSSPENEIELWSVRKFYSDVGQIIDDFEPVVVVQCFFVLI